MITAKLILTGKETYDSEYSTVSKFDALEAMIEFAKLHVEACLKKASMKSRLRIVPNNENTYFKEEILVSNIENSTQNMWISIEDTSILNAYALENIK